MIWKLKRLWAMLTEEPVYVGRVVGQCQIVEEGKAVRGGRSEVIWNLFETPSGYRTYQKVGQQFGSAHQHEVKAQVLAWAKGGPLPDEVERGPEPLPDTKVITIDGERVG